MAGASTLAFEFLAGSHMACSISADVGRDDSLRSSIVISGLSGVVAASSSAACPPSVPVSESGTVTIESVGRGWLSTCVLGERAATSFTSIGMALFSSSIATSSPSFNAMTSADCEVPREAARRGTNDVVNAMRGFSKVAQGGGDTGNGSGATCQRHKRRWRRRRFE